jgi:hypothetical protein
MKAFIGNSEVHQVAMLECSGVRVNVGVPSCRQSLLSYCSKLRSRDIMKVLKIDDIEPPPSRDSWMQSRRE